MKFVDEALITVLSGSGGRGCISFRREKFIPRGGPDGGDGGKGGDVALRAAAGKRTLYDFRHQKHFKAQNGQPGQGRQKTGRDGKDLVIDLPPGTLIRDAETDRVLADLVEAGQMVVVAEGGRGGQGNTRFKSATHRTPRLAQPGEPGRRVALKLELKLIADVGIIGLPNAGKSTLIRAISSANPKIGDYPFTTLNPNLGVVRDRNNHPFVVADIPGLIAGAHKGIGVGIRFLRHIERSGLLVHLIDAAQIDPNAPLEVHRVVNTELSLFGHGLIDKPQIVVLNKMDLPGTAETARLFESAFKGAPVLRISAATGVGIDRLVAYLSRQICNRDPSDAIQTATESTGDDGRQNSLL